MTWLNAIFLWFYCLDLKEAILLAVGGALLFLLLNRWLSERRLWRAFALCLLLSWVAVILWVTVWSRAPGETSRETMWIPLHSYYTALNGGEKELLRSNLMNVLLFCPAGLLLGAVLPGKWSVPKKLVCTMGLLGLLSVGIEAAQYFGQLGRAETDDVIHNALGALLGGVAACIVGRAEMRRRSPCSRPGEQRRP